MKLCFASNNTHKTAEIVALLDSRFQLITLAEAGIDEELAETQDTLEGNAQQKALYVFEQCRISCFADDTGLEVDALNGEPGVWSARYAGPHRNSEDNIQMLLTRLAGKANRKAQFRTVISLIMPQGQWLFEGVLKGVIVDEARGKEGFGYDPIFRPVNSQKTIAEMSMVEKNRISHRAQAIRKLTEFLRTL